MIINYQNKKKIIDFYRNGTNEQKEFINKIINQ